MLDFKRSEHKLGGAQRGHWGARGKGVASDLADTPFHRYSLQLACYALMLMQSQGIDAGDRLYLLRMHPSLGCARTSSCSAATCALGMPIRRLHYLGKLASADPTRPHPDPIPWGRVRAFSD